MGSFRQNLSLRAVVSGVSGSSPGLVAVEYKGAGITSIDGGKFGEIQPWETATTLAESAANVIGLDTFAIDGGAAGKTPAGADIAASGIAALIIENTSSPDKATLDQSITITTNWADCPFRSGVILEPGEVINWRGAVASLPVVPLDTITITAESGSGSAHYRFFAIAEI